MKRGTRLALLRATCQGRHFLAPPHPKAPPCSSDLVIDAYGAFETPRDQLDICAGEIDFGTSYEDDVALRSVGEVQIEHRVALVRAPVVVARGTPPVNFDCYCCGQGVGYDVQLPLNVFTVGHRMGGGEVGIACIVEMARVLERGEYGQVLSKTSCCRNVRCLLAQDLLSPENYAAWVESKTQRPQLERGTDRKDQGLVFSENVIFLRCLAVQTPAVLTDKQLSALFEFLVLNSQFIQEREKRFIATAMAAVENPNHFTYKFGNAQSLVERMARMPRNYASNVIFPHILDKSTSAFRWRSKGNRLIETAFPKAADALFAFMCELNAEVQGNERVDGRIAHRVPVGAPHLPLFTPSGFKAALANAVAASPRYVLQFASSPVAMSSVQTGTETQRDMTKLLQLLSGTQKRVATIGKGAASAPTCGSLQSDSGVHTWERYTGVFKAEGYTDAECAEKVSIFVQKHENGNAVGFDKRAPLSGRAQSSKACAALRPVEQVQKRMPKPVTSARLRLGGFFTGLQAMKKTKRA